MPTRFWQLGDPPWLERMERLGFYLRWGAESFFMEQDWAPLSAVRNPGTGELISNVAYTKSYGLPLRRDQEVLPFTHRELRSHLPEPLRGRARVRAVETDREVLLNSSIIECYGTVFRLGMTR